MTPCASQLVRTSARPSAATAAASESRQSSDSSAARLLSSDRSSGCRTMMRARRVPTTSSSIRRRPSHPRLRRRDATDRRAGRCRPAALLAPRCRRCTDVPSQRSTARSNCSIQSQLRGAHDSMHEAARGGGRPCAQRGQSAIAIRGRAFDSLTPRRADRACVHVASCSGEPREWQLNVCVTARVARLIRARSKISGFGPPHTPRRCSSHT